MVLLDSLSNEIGSMFSHETQDLQIKQEPILDEANGPSPYNNSFIKQENASHFNNSILYAMGSDLLPKTKRSRTEDTEDDIALKRMKTKEGVPNFRRPWPKAVKSSALYSTTNEGNASQSFTNFSISNLIKDDNSTSKEMINDQQLHKSTPYSTEIPRMNYHDHDRNKDLDTNFIKQEHNVPTSYLENSSNHDTRTLMATKISEVQNDLNITNDSEDYENESFNMQNEIYEKDTNHRFINDNNKVVKAHNKLNDSNLFWTVQNANTEPLKLVISKENNTSNSKNISKIKDHSYNLDREEQPLELANKENLIASKNPIKISNSNTDHLKMVPSKVNNITPISEIKKNKSNLDIQNSEDTGVINNYSHLCDSNAEHFEPVSSKEKKKHKSKKKSKRREKKHLDIDRQPNAIHDKENTPVSKHKSEISNLNAEHLELVLSKEPNKTPNFEKKSKRKEKDKCYTNNEQPLLTNEEHKIVSKLDKNISSSQNKQEIKIKIESSFLNTPGNVGKNLQVSTPLRDIKKSKSFKRYSLPNTSNIKPNINDSLNNQVDDKKITQAPRVFMKKITWNSVLEKEKIYTDTRIKIHKMIFRQEDGATSEIAVKAHLENLDWSSLELVPKTMIVEEGAAMANLQGIKGVPYLCGVIIEDPPALVMSYYKGRTLGDYLEEGDTLLSLRTFSRACEIVGKIHHRGWAHYDLHADNILGRVNNNGSMSVTLLNYGFCRTTSVNPHYGVYCDTEDLEGHHLPADIIDQKCSGTYVDRYSLCYILEEINSQLKEVSETVDIRDASSLGLMTEQPHLRPSSSHLAQLVSKLVSKHNHDSWKFGIDD